MTARLEKRFFADLERRRMECARIAPEGLGFDLPETCRNGWVVEQLHILGTAPEIQESLIGPAENVRKPKRPKPQAKGAR